MLDSLYLPVDASNLVRSSTDFAFAIDMFLSRFEIWFCGHHASLIVHMYHDNFFVYIQLVHTSPRRLAVFPSVSGSKYADLLLE